MKDQILDSMDLERERGQVEAIRRIALYEPRRVSFADFERIHRMPARDRIKVCLGLDMEDVGAIREYAVRLMIEVYYRESEMVMFPVILRVKHAMLTSKARAKDGRSFPRFAWDVAGEIEKFGIGHQYDAPPIRFPAHVAHR